MILLPTSISTTRTMLPKARAALAVPSVQPLHTTITSNSPGRALLEQSRQAEADRGLLIVGGNDHAADGGSRAGFVCCRSVSFQWQVLGIGHLSFEIVLARRCHVVVITSAPPVNIM